MITFNHKYAGTSVFVIAMAYFVAAVFAVWIQTLVRLVSWNLIRHEATFWRFSG